jgi:hypothetical protein
VILLAVSFGLAIHTRRSSLYRRSNIMAALAGPEKVHDWEGIVLQAAKRVIPSLRENGYGVVDNALGYAVASTLQEEALSLSEKEGGFSEHLFRFGKSAAQVRKPHIFEADLHDKRLASLPCLRHFRELFDSTAFQKAFDSSLPELALQDGTTGTAIKLQLNKGKGGCFPFHYDNPGPPNKRALTAIIYLNKSWTPENGGELELQPFLGSPVIIPPLMDRMVVFYSDRILHRVRPSHCQRLCFSVWIDSASVNQSHDVHLKAKHIAITDDHSAERAADFFRSTPLQRVISRALYDKEYEGSLRDMHSSSAAEADSRVSARLLAEHRAHVSALTGNAALAPFLAALAPFKETALSDDPAIKGRGAAAAELDEPPITP